MFFIWTLTLLCISQALLIVSPLLGGAFIAIWAAATLYCTVTNTPPTSIIDVAAEAGSEPREHHPCLMTDRYVG